MPIPRVSFEFFPPKTLNASFGLWQAVEALAPLDPDYVSVTYGAGGTTRDLTLETAGLLTRKYRLRVAGHLTCVTATRAETLKTAQGYADAGVTRIVALRGDAPKGQDRFTPHPDGFASSVELVDALSRTGKFDIRVGAYPERHPDAADSDADVTWLKRKVDAGAASAITQFFFDPDIFLRFRDRCVAAGVVAPIIPGILPLQNWSTARTLAARCGTTFPDRLAEAFEAAERTGQTAPLALTECTRLCTRLVHEGVNDLHFYTINRPGLTRDVCRALGVERRVELENVA